MTQTPTQLHLDLSDKATHSVSLVGVYRLLVMMLLVAILATSVAVARQTQERHETYRTLQQLKRDLAVMKIEEERLLIEQQTFSATPQVARRAVGELGMFFPSSHHKKIITPPTHGESP